MFANKQIRTPYLPDDVGVQSGKGGLIKLGSVKETKNKTKKHVEMIQQERCEQRGQVEQ